VKGLYSKPRAIKRLFAAGEVTGGVHGENRLGGNSLLVREEGGRRGVVVVIVVVVVVVVVSSSSK